MNAHVGVVLPGVSVSVNTVLSKLERDPGEYVVDPWVIARATLVAVVRDRLVAAAHLVRYGDEPRVSDDYRDAGEIAWLVFFPGTEDAADALASACLDVLDGWRVTGSPAPLPGLSLRRELGGHATRFSAVLDERVVGFSEVEADLTVGGTRSRLEGWRELTRTRRDGRMP